MRAKDAINFLLYSYFEITLDTSDVDEVINAAIKRAYKDASSHVLSIKESVSSDEKNHPKSKGTNIIHDGIIGLLDGHEYRDFHQDICWELKTELKQYTGKEEERQFSCGIAQKWVNMTMKYLCIINSIFHQFDNKLFDSYKDYGRRLEELEAELDVPVDSYILESASYDDTKQKRNAYALNIKVPRKKPKGKEDFYHADKSLPWSKWDFEKEEDWRDPKNYYNKFQENIKTEIQQKNIMREDELNCRVATALEWEGLAWIETAQNRKGTTR